MLTDQWRKSTRSGPNSDNCVEVQTTPGVVNVRDTKDHGAGPVLSFTPDEWQAFLEGAADGEFDLLG